MVEPGFRVVSPTSTAVATSAMLVPQYSPSSYTGRTFYCRPTPVQHSLFMTTPPSMLPGSPLGSSGSGLSPQEIVASSMFGGGSPSYASQQGSTSHLNSSFRADLNTSSTSRISPIGRVSWCRMHSKFTAFTKCV